MARQNHKVAIKQAVEHYITVAEFLFGLVVPRPKVSFRLHSTVVGVSNYPAKTIEFHREYAAHQTEFMLTNTVLHEVAHYVTDHMTHPDLNPEEHCDTWKTVAVALGLHDPVPHATLPALPSEYEARCNCCGKHVAIPQKVYDRSIKEHAALYHLPCGQESKLVVIRSPKEQNEQHKD